MDYRWDALGAYVVFCTLIWGVDWGVDWGFDAWKQYRAGRRAR
jgi:hypothetical protein